MLSEDIGVDWLSPALGPIIASVITFFGTSYITRRKERLEGAGTQLEQLNAGTKLLMDALFQQIAALGNELEHERAGRKADREEFERRITDLQARLPGPLGL